MEVTVLAFGVLRERMDVAAGRAVAVSIDQGATVRDLATHLRLPDGLVYSILIDGEHSKLDSVLSEGAEVTLMPAFTGGSATLP